MKVILKRARARAARTHKIILNSAEKKFETWFLSQSVVLVAGAEWWSN